MGLPTKKQLKKHKRGARKALDTLDILDSMKENSEEDKAKKKTDEKPVKQPKTKKREKKSTSDQKIIEEKIEKKEKTKKVSKKAQVVLESDIDNEVKETGEIEKSTVVKKETEPENVSKLDQENKAETVEAAVSAQKSPEKSVLEVIKKEQSAPPEVEQQSAKTETKSPSIEKNPVEKANEQIMETFDDEFDEDTLDDRYLLFNIMGEDYGIEIRYVTEIVVMQKITEVPDTPDYINGVINLRGKVIPVIDIRIRFSLEKKEYDDRSCIIVVCVGDIDLGFIVDTVREVVDIKADMVDPPPRSHIGVENNFIKGMGKMGKKVKILLDVHEVIKKN